jgi:DNA polymerase epsilon subunit 1
LEKEDLDLNNHLKGIRKKYLKLTFYNFEYLKLAKLFINQMIKKNKKEAVPYFNEIFQAEELQFHKHEDASEFILGLREHDLMYYTRVTIDKGCLT